MDSESNMQQMEAEEAVVIDVSAEPEAEPAEMEWEVETVAPEETEETEGPTIEIPYAKSCNKHLFTWLFSFFLGIYGVDRFVRGQWVLGVLKITTLGGMGIWYLADWIIAAKKSYADSFADMDDLLFDSRGNYVM